MIALARRFAFASFLACLPLVQGIADALPHRGIVRIQPFGVEHWSLSKSQAQAVFADHLAFARRIYSQIGISVEVESPELRFLRGRAAPAVGSGAPVPTAIPRRF